MQGQGQAGQGLAKPHRYHFIVIRSWKLRQSAGVTHIRQETPALTTIWGI